MPSRSRSVPPPGRPPRPLEHPGRYPGRPRGPSLGRTHSRPFYRRLACVRSDLLRHGHQLDHLLTVSWPVSWLEIAQAPPPQQAEEQMSATPAGPADAGARRWTRSARTMEASDVVRTRQGAPADRGWRACEAATCPPAPAGAPRHGDGIRLRCSHLVERRSIDSGLAPSK
jgi:hypothetical protein